MLGDRGKFQLETEWSDENGQVMLSKELERSANPSVSSIVGFPPTRNLSWSPHIRALIAGSCQYYTNVGYLCSFKMALPAFASVSFPFYWPFVNVSGTSSYIRKRFGSFRDKVRPGVFSCVSL